MPEFSLAGWQFLLRGMHLLSVIVWLGLSYYFNFIHNEYFREAVPDARADLIRKLVPLGVTWSRIAALCTVLTGALLLLSAGRTFAEWSLDLGVGVLLGVMMLANVLFVIWPKYRIACGLSAGDASVAGPRAQLASRINVVFSLPLILFMTSAAHLAGVTIGDTTPARIVLVLLIVAALEVHAVTGRIWTVMLGAKGLAGCSIAFALLLWAVVHWV